MGALTLAIFGLLSLLIVALDQLSTWYFVKPSMIAYGDPGRYESNRILKRLLSKFGAPRGQFVYAPLEALGWVFVMTILYSSLLYVGPSSPFLKGSEFWVSILIPLIDLAIVLPINYLAGLKVRRELASRDSSGES
ncbi:MAG: hypothetical protein ABSB29_07170 [Nitrososphaerales archaeon]|jgi:hypothetical protein